MSVIQEIGVDLNHKDRERVTIFLKKFLHHVDNTKLVICGGLATRFHLIQHGIDFPKRQFNDLDLLIQSINDIRPSIISDFMLYHYHPPGRDDPVETTYFFYAFVDPVSRMKTDVFPYRWSAPERFIQAKFQDKPIKVVGIEDQLIQCLYDVSRISDKQKVDPKQLKDVHILMQIADVKLAEKIWKQNNHPLYPPTLTKAIEKADLLTITHPEWWQAKPYRQQKPYHCPNCQSRSDYPITNIHRIYQILGYIE